jgi:hypothetical protein
MSTPEEKEAQRKCQKERYNRKVSVVHYKNKLNQAYLAEPKGKRNEKVKLLPGIDFALEVLGKIQPDKKEN